jgi:hypothetical protein
MAKLIGNLCCRMKRKAPGLSSVAIVLLSMELKRLALKDYLTINLFYRNSENLSEVINVFYFSRCE